jgi:uncharacterized protein (UPF0548 family)
VLVTIGSPSSAAITRLLEAAAAAAPTYEHQGATLTGRLPDGYRHDRWSVALGTGSDAFEAAIRGLRQWEGHRHAGITVHPATPPEPGATVAVVIPIGPLTLTVANRIITVVNDERRFAFVYGTLPGHGEQGEEAFAVTRGIDDTVTFDIVAFSRPAGIARLGTPAVRVLQLRATRLYLAGLQQHVRGETP